jgi:glutamine synthetase
MRTLSRKRSAVLILTGLRVLQDELPEPPLIEDDPTGLDEEERRSLGIRELPGSLDEALATDEVVRSWFSSDP